MKIQLVLLAGITLMLGCLSCTKTRDSNADLQTLIVGTNANYPPFEFLDENQKVVGFDPELADLISKKLGRKLLIKEFDFDSLILALKQGKIDLIISGMSITEDRQKEINMIPYQGSEVKALSFLFWDQKPETATTLAQLATHLDQGEVTVQAGTFMEEFLTQCPEAFKIKSFAGPTEQLLDLKYKKSKSALVELAIADELMRLNPELKRVDIPLPKNKQVLGNGIGLTKTNTDLQTKVSEIISEFKKDGTIQSLEKKWIGTSS